MHSRPKVPLDEAKERVKLEKALQFQAALQSLLQARAGGKRSRELLAPIGELLHKCPELSTLWNYRREILIGLKEAVERASGQASASSEGDQEPADTGLRAEFDRLCSQELTFTENCLKVNQKCYQTWHHRAWLLTFAYNVDLKRERELCNQFLLLDERNFHCWDYRRYVVELSHVPTTEELDFCDQKLKTNFSNFSAWHLRSSLLRKLAREQRDPQALAARIDAEFQLAQEGIFTDPNDQSIWFYFRWLLDLYARGVESLAEEQKNAASVTKFVRFVCTPEGGDEYTVLIELDNPKLSTEHLKISVDGKAVQFGRWSYHALNDSFVYWTRAKLPDMATDAVCFTFSYELDPNLFPSQLSFKGPTSTGTLVYDSQPTIEQSKLDMEKLSSLKELLEEEPDNKWLNFTLALMDSEMHETTIEKLVQIDPLRTNYYRDLRSKAVCQRAVEREKSHRRLEANLSRLGLHSVWNLARLAHVQRLDLSGNHLIRLGVTFLPLVNLRVLRLEGNRIHLFDSRLRLPSLRLLNLAHNPIDSRQMVEQIVTAFDNLAHLVLKGTPVASEEGVETIANDRAMKIYWKEDANDYEEDVQSGDVWRELDARW